MTIKFLITAEHRVRLLREAGHDIGMSMCFMRLDEGEEVHELRITLKSKGTTYDHVEYQPVEIPAVLLEERLNAGIDAVLRESER